MLLVLVRHGPAGDRAAWAAAGRKDFFRPLTAGGRVKTRQAAKGLTRVVGRLEVLAASSLVRARQTAELLAARYPKATRLSRPELAPAADPRRTALWLGTLKEGAVAVVGHEPHLSRLIALLVTQGRRPLFELKKAGAAVLEFDGPCRPGAGRLEALLPPRTLRRLGR